MTEKGVVQKPRLCGSDEIGRRADVFNGAPN
jgi:hypothetical protein